MEKYPQTQSQKIKEYLIESYSQLLDDNDATVDPVIFRYCGNRRFKLERKDPSDDNSRVFEIGIEYMDTKSQHQVKTNLAADKFRRQWNMKTQEVFVD